MGLYYLFRDLRSSLFHMGPYLIGLNYGIQGFKGQFIPSGSIFNRSLIQMRSGRSLKTVKSVKRNTVGVIQFFGLKILVNNSETK